jgi:hypothetical protein
MFFGFGCMLRLAVLATVIFLIGLGATVILIAESGYDFVDLPGVSDDPQPGTLEEVIEKRDLFEDVPYISQVSTEPAVVGTNIGLAIFFATVFGALGAMLNNLVREHEKELEDWLEYFYIKRLFDFFRIAVGQDVQRGCLGMPIIITIFALYGIIFAFLEPGTSIFEPAGLQLAIVMAMSVALVSLSGDIAQRQLATFWRKTARFGIYPANLSLAVLTTALSRLVGFTPGIMFGTPGGVDIDMDGETRFREVVLSALTLVVVIGFGAAGWILTALIRSQDHVELSGATLELVSPAVQLMMVFGLALFVVAIETAFFEMIPLALTSGSRLFRWNPLLWGVVFMPIVFVASHTIFNPEGEYLSAFTETPILLLVGAAIILASILVWFWALFRFFDPPHIVAQKRREAYQRRQNPSSPPGDFNR